MMTHIGTMASAAAHVEREYGENYRAEAVKPHAVGGHLGAVFQVTTSDGSWFRVWADQWGNAGRICDDSECWDEAGTGVDIIRGGYFCEAHSRFSFVVVK